MVAVMKKFSIQTELTNHCNFRCWQCPHSVYQGRGICGNSFDREKGFMSKKLFNIVLENAQKYARVIGLGFFGEQLLHPQFDEFMSLIPTNREYKLRINTNWSLVTEKTMETLKKFDSVRVSLDASHKNLYDVLRPGTSTLDLDGNHVKDFYKTIVEKLEHWFNLPDHPPTDIVYVVSSRNVMDRSQFVKQWQPRIDKNDNVLTKLIISYGGVMHDGYMAPNACKIPERNIFVVGWNGDCSPCNLDVNLDLKSGNLIETTDMMEIVYGDVWQQTLEKIERKEGICANCFDANNWSRNKWYSGPRKRVYKIKKAKVKHPRYSVVIPVRDRYNFHLFKCLESLQQQTLPGVEVIISDYGSKRAYTDILKFLKPFDVTVYYCPTRAIWSTSVARNMGIRRALSGLTSGLILVIDSDLVLESKTLEALYDCHLHHPNSLVVSKLCYLPRLGVFNLPEDLKYLRSVGKYSAPGVGAVMSAPKKWWYKVRGFDERMRGWGGPDTDLWKRAKLDGIKRIVLPNIEGASVIYHQYHPPTKFKRRMGIYYLLYRINRFIWRFDKSIIRNNENWGVWE